MFLVLGICGQAKKHWKHIEISRASKMFLNLLTHIFASWEANFLSARMFPEVQNRETLIENIMFSQQCFPVCL